MSEVYIDGVNVAECENYTTIEDCDGIHDLCELLDDYCSIKKNCYYKQLKRLEAENEKLKKEVENLNFYINEYKIVWEIEKKEKYKQAFEDIKKLAELEVIIFDGKALFPTNIQRIIDIINEVLEND